jgi:hypothetical protein
LSQIASKDQHHTTISTAKRTNVVGVLPLEPHLQVVVLVHELQEPVEQVLGLEVGDAVDVANVPANGEHALPPGHGVGANDRVHGLELATNVLGRATLLFVDAKAGVLGDLVEVRLREGRRQGLEELLERLADLVVDLVARGPEGVCQLLGWY